MPAKKSSAKAKQARKPIASKTAKKAAAKTDRKVAKTKSAARKAPAQATGSTRKAKVSRSAAPKKTRAPSAPAKTAATSKPKAAATSRKGPKQAPPQPETPRRAPVAEPLQSEVEDLDGEYDTNLLSGPRNVQPYVPRRGEQYMNKEQLEHFRQILFTWKRDLMEEVDRTVLHMKDEAANFPDPNDRATQESEFSLELRTRDRERKLIRKIDEALKRIDDGSYGYCVETGEEIGIKRLEARPVATLCVEAQERRERREKQYGDRDDRYR